MMTNGNTHLSACFYSTKSIVISITFSHIVKIIIIIKMKLIKTLCNTANGYGFFTFVAISVPA